MNAKPTIDDLEILTPDELGELLRLEVKMYPMDVQFIQDLLDVGCPINVWDKYNWIPLHLAARNGNLEVVEFLLSKEADVNARDKWGNRALHLAVKMGHLKVVRFLVQAGAQVDARDNWGWTAWDIASTKTRKAVPELEPK